MACQVIEYFDAFLIGLTATPDSRTYGFFHKNVVSEYDHEQAVADGVNVGNGIFVIETERSRRGAVPGWRSSRSNGARAADATQTLGTPGTRTKPIPPNNLTAR
ncbi:MAG: hypothetical protein R3F37_08615 [Candidatus Competibacteraceae bacterium]